MVDTDLYNAYSAALVATADVCEAAMTAALALFTSEADLDMAYKALIAQYGGVSADIAAEFYANQRALANVDDVYDAAPYVAANEALLTYDVRNNTRAQLPGLAGQRVLESADNTIQTNMRRDPAKVKWALIPHPGACGWCRMMSSNGFAYSHEYEAGEGIRHAHCRCTMVADFDVDNPKLEGYDDSALYKQYRNARAKVESSAQAEWNAMSDEEQQAFKDKTPKGRGAYDRFLRNKIVAQMNA